ncbi:MAG TPA: sulfotransferase [Acidimicrobiales bacterium]|nr:sulfotransferase [Acidimicrobiales bacterium]
MPGVVLLGMHRSGTSAVSRILNLLGADVGPESDLLTEYDNPAGHWENKALMACNDRILAAFGRSWDFPPWLTPGWEYSARASSLLPELAETFEAVYRSDPWVWKDPRTCLTFPLWRRVLGSEARVVIVWRDPGSVVTSVRRRDGIPSLYTVGLWLRYVRASVAAAAGLPVVCLRFEDLVESPTAAVQRLVDDLRALGVDLQGDPHEAAASMRDDLVHASDASALVRRLTTSTLDILSGLPRRSEEFRPPSWREPRWVRPWLFAYRGPWVLRARAGHPLHPGFA